MRTGKSYLRYSEIWMFLQVSPAHPPQPCQAWGAEGGRVETSAHRSFLGQVSLPPASVLPTLPLTH